jgi:hypothetical protein
MGISSLINSFMCFQILLKFITFRFHQAHQVILVQISIKITNQHEPAKVVTLDET